MKKRKKGSTLITVLALSIIFMALGGAILTAIMGTMKSNVNQKIREDLKYAAESGLEIARSYLSEKSTITQSDLDNINKRLKEILVDIDKNDMPDKQIGKVELVSPIIDEAGNITNVKQKEKSNIITVKVKAEEFNRPENVEYSGVNYEFIKGGKGNGAIFEHSIVASEGTVEILQCRKAGCLEECPNRYGCCKHCYGHSEPGYGSGEISSGKGTIINGEMKKPDDKIKENTYKSIEFLDSVKKVQYLKMKAQTPIDIINEVEKLDIKDEKNQKIDITKIEVDANKKNEFLVDGKDKKNLDELQKMSKEPVILLEVVNIADRKIKILLTNAEKVELLVHGGASAIKYGIWINKGELEVIGTGSLHLAYSTLFSKEIRSFTEMSMDISYPSGDASHGVIKDFDKVNEIIQIFIPTWDKTDSDSNGSSIDQIKLEENSFEN